MEPLPYKEPHRPPALSYESPLRYDAAADRHQLWAERTRRVTSRARKFVLIAFAVLWLITAILMKAQATHSKSQAGLLLILILHCLAASYVILVAVGTAHRPSAILPRLLVFALIAIAWSYMVAAAVDFIVGAYQVHYAYGIRGLNPNSQSSTLFMRPFVALVISAAFTAAGVVCYVLLQVFAHNRTYRPETDTH